MATSKIGKHKITFSVVAPDARAVQLLGDFSEWEHHPVDMKRLQSGQWKATVALREGRYEYRFLIDGQWKDDPACSTRVPNTFGSENCVCIVN
jgi:1,4-alpha-glucan branching enzyme